MRELLALLSLILWLALMIWVYRNSPEWFFVPFFFLATFGYLRLMETTSKSS
ncbi:hypothetical protein [Myxacorys almedinensis]|uniref:Uncharacterized protein n=1 Tax=Myxacorys almedinensis A TaxID=2690445 RepID=A0A8J7YZZ6_9CYAN|nr:hypothetical protein [Myxacorys almedinensis]NDJ17712.1 hypothetical protein [Myxacorys almedinensis A]